VTVPFRVVNINAWIGAIPRGFFGVASLEPPGHKDRRLDALAETLEALSPDVVTLQECLPLPGFARQLADRLGYDLLFRVCNGGLRLFGLGLPPGVGAGEGLAILARRDHGMRHLATTKLSGLGSVNRFWSLQLGPVRYAIAARLVVGGEPVIVVNTHIRYGFPNRATFIKAWEELHAAGHVDTPLAPGWLVRLARVNRRTRDAELRRLGAWLLKLRQRTGGTPIVIGADFNIDPGQPRLELFLNATGYTNLLPEFVPDALTWDPARNPNCQLGLSPTWPDGGRKSIAMLLMTYLDSVPQCPDHIMASPGLHAVRAALCANAPVAGIFPSDHYGILADFDLGR
jgi:endonuclease/exonuclease/phosphatase family metal-dependent hydrolase